MDYTLSEFLAHAIALEREAAERYLELADMMEAHRNDDVSRLFRDMVRYSRMHHDSIVERAGTRALPTIGAWQYRWRHPPEAGGDEAFDPSLNAYDALRYARENEQRALAYYADVGQSASDPEVRRLAAEFAAEETEHVEAIDDWLARTQRPSATWAADPHRGE
ncbi:MAG: ferritin family protein [Burkholderiaceae bacterium]